MYRIARASTIRMIVDTFEEWVPAVEYYEWDAHAESFQLPTNDLIGLVGFSCTRNGDFHDLDFAVAIMTQDDPGLERMIRYVDKFYTERFEHHMQYPILQLDTGAPTGFSAIIFDGTTVSPITRADARPATEITVSARLTRAGRLE